MLIPATGHGTVAATELSDLLSLNGFTMEQVERTSTRELGCCAHHAPRSVIADAGQLMSASLQRRTRRDGRRNCAEVIRGDDLLARICTLRGTIDTR